MLHQCILQVLVEGLVHCSHGTQRNRARPRDAELHSLARIYIHRRDGMRRVGADAIVDTAHN